MLDFLILFPIVSDQSSSCNSPLIQCWNTRTEKSDNTCRGEHEISVAAKEVQLMNNKCIQTFKNMMLVFRLMHTLCVQDSLKASTIATELILSIDHLRQLSLTSAATDASTANSFGTNETNQQQQSATEGIPTPTGAFNGEPTPPSPPIINQPAEFGTEQQTASDAPASMFHMFNTRTEALCGEPMAISSNNITATALMRMESNNTNNSTGTTSVSVTMVPMFTH